MNNFLAKSIAIANDKNYLDRLYSIYSIDSNEKRKIDENLLNSIKLAYINKDDKKIIEFCLKLQLFPIKDSYVAYLKKDHNFISKNPETIKRLSEKIYDLGWENLLEKIIEPKESNRQMGNKFSNWIKKNPLGVCIRSEKDFMKDESDAILIASDNFMKDFSKKHFNYSRNKGLDFVARINKKYIIGEAKFLSDQGGHQNAQFEYVYTFQQKV